MKVEYFIEIFIFANIVKNQCPKYQCLSLENSVCAKFDLQASYKINTFFCKNHQTCPLRGNTSNIYCEPDLNLLALPGMWASSIDMCETSQRDSKSGICTGFKEGEHCLFIYDCDVDLFCNENRICEKAKDENEFCGENQNIPFCKSYLTCFNKSCTQYGSQKVGTYTNNPLLCETNSINTNGECSYGKSLLGDILRDDLSDFCYYNDSSKSPPTCTYREDNLAVCGLESGDTINYFEKLLNYTKLKPSCSIYYKFGLCDNGKKVGNLQEAVEAYARIPVSFNHFQKQYIGEIAKCAKRYSNEDLWRMAEFSENFANFIQITLSILIFLFL